MSMSKSAIQRLGKRLQEPDGATDDALSQLEELLIDYDDLLSAARGVIDNLCDALSWPLGVTHRLKTTDTLIQKLRRAKEKGESTNLARVQDIAGIRVSGDITLTEQNDLRDMIIEAFTKQGHTCTMRDRREEPVVGYRAVHVIVTLGSQYVEVQIRTTAQDLWANVFERIADIFGRDIRYGKDPEIGGQAAKDVIAGMESMSEELYALEKLADEGVATPGGQEATLEVQKRLDALRRVLRQIETIKGGLPT
ncbi:hypothetical protein ACFY8W_12550 [Streptomyces sp. NPDC012637]|uniref:hypothetical protein n=1 Tax=Streptomyces sp. NPDC012637 TaxID=3364842 RepID=UPI0036EDA584